MSKNFSIIIPIKDRSEFTFRVLSYLALNNFSYKIYLSDGSYNKHKNKKIYNIFKKKLDLIYLPFSYDKNYFFFLKKIYQTLKIVDAQNIMLLPNDDFININFFKKHINKKISNKIISGINLDFKINNFFNYINDFGKISKRTSKKKNYNINLKNKNKIQRVKFMKYFNPWESILPKKILLKVFSYSLDFKAKNHYEFMWFFQLIPLYHAKCIFLSKPIIARQSNTYSSEGDAIRFPKNFSNPIRLKQFKNFIFSKTKNKELLNLINNLEFIYAPNYSILSIIIQKTVYLKLFLSKVYINLNYFQNKIDTKKKYLHIFKFIKNYFKNFNY